MAADGSLNFDTKVDEEGFKKGVSSLKRAVDTFVKKINLTGRQIDESFEKSEKVVSLENQIEQTEERIRGLVSELKEMENVHIPTEEYKTLSKETEKAELKLEGLLNRQEKFENTGKSKQSSAWKSLQYDIETATRKLAGYEKRMQLLKDNGNAFMPGSSSAAYQKKAEELSSLNGKLYEQKQKLNEVVVSENAATQGGQQYIGMVDSLKMQLGRLPAYFKGIGRSAITGLATAPIKLFTGSMNGALWVTKKVASGMKNLGFGIAKKAAISAGKEFLRLSKSLLGLERSAKKSKKGFSAFGMLGRSLMFSMVFRALSGIGNALKEGTQNFAQYSDSFNSTMSSFTSSLSQLKNSFASAFSPVTSVAIPILDALIQKLIQVINVVGQFLSALGGSSTYTKAVKVNKDYAASLKKTGGAAKSAGQDAKKALAPFDDLVQIQQEGADSSGGGGTGSVDPSQMFTEETIDSGISGFANKLKELFEAEDWTGIGRLIGGKVNEAVLSFGDYISWDNVGVEVTAFVLAFTAILNSAVGIIDWYSVGIAAGNGMDTLFNTLHLLLTEIDWALLGTALAYGLNGIVDTVDWNLFGATIGAYFQARISGLYGFVSTADWPGIGQAIGSSLMGMTNQIDWSMLGLTFALGLNGVFDVLGNAAMTYDWTNLGSSLAMSLSIFFQNFDWAGSAGAVSTIIIGLLDALITFIAETDWMAVGEGVAVALENIDWATIAARLWTVFWNAVFSAFAVFGSFLGTLIVDGVTAAKEYFQGKIEECGGDIWLGIAKGILDAIKGIGKWVIDNIFFPFVDAFKNAFGIHSPSKVMAEMGQYLWDGFCDGIKEFFSNPGDFIKANITDPFINSIRKFLGIHSPSTVMEGIGSNTVAGFNKGVTNEQSDSQNVIRSWAEGVAKWFSNKFGIGNNDAEESRKWATSIMSGFNTTVSSQYTNSQSIMERWAENTRKWFVGNTENKGVNEASWKKYAGNIVKAFTETITARHTDTQIPMEFWAESSRKWFTGTDETAGVNEAGWANFADNVIRAFSAAINTGHTGTREPVESWSMHVREWFWGDTNSVGTGGLYMAFYNMAKRINEGFANGVSDFAHMAKAAIREWAEEVMDEAEEEFDIHSPSREFRAIAEYVIKGFNEGISDMASTSQAAAQHWLDSVLDIFDGVDVSVPIGLDIPNAASYMPRIATGTVVPPKAGEASASMRGNGQAQEETLLYLLQKIDELITQFKSDGDRTIEIVLNLTGNLASLARILKPELDKEAARKGVNLVIVGGV